LNENGTQIGVPGFIPAGRPTSNCISTTEAEVCAASVF